MRIALTVTEGPGTGREFSFEGHDFFIVGRSHKAHFRLPREDRLASRFHFLVEVSPPFCRLLDMKSRNKTFVNGQEVEKADLKDGDAIRVGKSVLRVSVESDSAADEATVAGGSAKVPQPPVNRVSPPRRAASSAPSGEPCRVCGAKAEPQPPGVEPIAPLCGGCGDQVRRQPQSIPGYQIVDVLGKGGMGIVYRALAADDGSVVALKTFLPKVTPTPKQIARFLRDAGILAQLKHPNIVAFREVGQAEGQLFCAMEYVAGTDAGRLLASQGPLPVPRAVHLACGLLAALEYAHGLGFVHRDIKPANLLVATVKGHETAKLTDFGLAREYQASMMSGLTTEGELGGTLAFMPPEQITHFRQVKPAADQYSAAATLYNLLTNRFVYDLPPRDVKRQLLMILEQDPVPIQSRQGSIPAELAGIVHKALAREPADRCADVAEFRRALAKFC